MLTTPFLNEFSETKHFKCKTFNILSTIENTLSLMQTKMCTSSVTGFSAEEIGSVSAVA